MKESNYQHIPERILQCLNILYRDKKIDLRSQDGEEATYYIGGMGNFVRKDHHWLSRDYQDEVDVEIMFNRFMEWEVVL